MNTSWRWAFGAMVGLFGIVGAMTLDGCHPQALLNWTPVLLLFGTAIGGLLTVRGATGIASICRTAFCGVPTDPDERTIQSRDLALLERSTMLGAGVGVFLGAAGAVANSADLPRVGPSLMVAISSIVLAMLFRVLFVLPLKQQLLAVDPAEERLTPRAASTRALRAIGIIALLTAGVTWAAGRAGAIAPPTPALLMALAAFVPSVLAAPRAILTGEVSGPRCRWLADALWSAGTLAVTTGVLHVFSVLDQPRMLAPGIACAFAGFLVPAAAAMLLGLRGSLAPAGAAADLEPKRSPFPAFAAFALVSLAAMVAFVAALLQQQPITD